VISGDVTGGVGDASGSVQAGANLAVATISGSIKGGSMPDSGAVIAGTLGTLFVQGDLVGGTDSFTGVIVVRGAATKVTVHGSLSGSQGQDSGSLVLSAVKSVIVDGSVKGGTGDFSGSILSRTLTTTNLTVSVGQDLIGGNGQESGSIVTVGENLTKVTVGGSMTGGMGTLSGSISNQFARLVSDAVGGTTQLATGSIGTATVLGNVKGGGGQDSGSIISEGKISSVLIGDPTAIDTTVGEVTGGAGFYSGSILAVGDLGSVTIRGDLTGYQSSVSGGDESGKVVSFGKITSVTIGGSVVGGSGSYQTSAGGTLVVEGQISAIGSIGKAKIGGSIQGGAGPYSGAIRGASIASLIVGDSVTGGRGSYSGSITTTSGDITSIDITNDLNTGDGGSEAAEIAAARNLGTLSVGTITGNAEAPEYILALGVLNPANDAQALAIKLINTSGAAAFMEVMAGYAQGIKPVNGDAQIGTVEIGDEGAKQPGVWQECDVIAGTIVRSVGDSVEYIPIDSTGKTKVISQIHEVVINGTIFSSTGSEHAIAAEYVKSIVVNGVSEQLTAGPRNDDQSLAADPSESTIVTEMPPVT
jgi:hypothetical protein